MTRTLELPIDEGFNYRQWRELAKTAEKTWEQETGFTLPETDVRKGRVCYPFLSRMKPGDSVFVDWRHDPNRVRSAALSYARHHGWHVVTKKSYESRSYGVRIFRLS